MFPTRALFGRSVWKGRFKSIVGIESGNKNLANRRFSWTGPNIVPYVFSFQDHSQTEWRAKYSSKEPLQIYIQNMPILIWTANSLPLPRQMPPPPGTPPIKTQKRAATILPNFVGLRFAVHNGKHYQDVMITEEMVGRKLGEYVSYVHVFLSCSYRHGRRMGSKEADLFSVI